MTTSGNRAWRVGLMFLTGSLLLLGVYGRSGASDEPFPAKPIRIVIPYQPAGGSDLSVRLMKDYLAKEFGVPIVFENMAGARGMIGTVSALRADPDGYTVLYGADGIVTGPLSSQNPPYDLFKDLLPIGHYGFLPIAYGVRANSRFKTIEELVTFAKAAPGRLSWGVTNFGGMSHLSVELFKKDARIDAKIVPFKGTGEAITALLGGHIDIQSLSYGAFQPYVNSGDVRILAVTDSLPGLNLPLLSAAGYSRVSMSLFNGFFASSRIRRPIYEKLVASFERVATNPELKKRWEQMGIVPDFKGPQSFTAFLKERQRITSMLIDDLQLKKQ